MRPAAAYGPDEYAEDDDDDDSSSNCSSGPSTTTTNNNSDEEDDDEEEQEISDFDDSGETSDEESLTDSGVSVSTPATLTKPIAHNISNESKKSIATLIPKDSAISLEDHLNKLPTSSTTTTVSTSTHHLQKPKRRRQRILQSSVTNPDESEHLQTAPKSPIIPSLFTDGDSVLYFPHVHEHTRPLPPQLPSTLVCKVCKYTPQVVRDVLRRTGFKLVKGGKDWVGFEVGRKDRLYENLMRGRGGGGGGVNGVKRRGVEVELTDVIVKPIDFLPQTFILPHQRRQLRLQFSSHPTWIVKPPTSARGNGIKLVSKWKDLPKKRECIVSSNSCYELYGFDVLLDETLKPWLMEANISPSLKASGEMDKGVKGRMVTDLFNLVGIKVGDCEEVGKWMGMKKPAPSPNPSTPQPGPESRQKQRLHLRSPHLDPLQHLLPTDIQCLKSTEDDFRRRGNFERLVPGPDVEFGYFGNVGYYDKLIGEWTRRSRNAGGLGLDGSDQMGAFVGPHVEQVPAAEVVSKDCFVVALKAVNVAVKEVGDGGVGSKGAGWRVGPTAPRTPKMMPWERSLEKMMMSPGVGVDGAGGRSRSGAGTPAAVGRSTPHGIRSTSTPSGTSAEVQRNTPTERSYTCDPRSKEACSTTFTASKTDPHPNPKQAHTKALNPSISKSHHNTILPPSSATAKNLINPSVLNLEPYDHPATPAASRPMPTKPHSHHPPQPQKVQPPRHLPPFTMTPEQPKGRLEPGDVVKFVSEMARLRSLQNAFRTIKRCDGDGSGSLIFGRVIGGGVREASGEGKTSLHFIQGPGDEDGFVEYGEQQVYQEEFEKGVAGYLPVGAQMGYEGLEQVSQIYGMEVVAAVQPEMAVRYMQQDQPPLYAPDPMNGMDVLDMNIYQMMTILPNASPTSKNTTNNTAPKPVRNLPFPIPLGVNPLHKRHQRHNITCLITIPASSFPSSIPHNRSNTRTILSTNINPTTSHRQIPDGFTTVPSLPAIPDAHAVERAHTLDVEETERGDSEEGGEGCCGGWDGGGEDCCACEEG
ncbi:Tubulin polyglutamylase ttll4 [Phlyctochytrium planicorne]|nr:Tubulin polyglutamylase ttll4 [Phlyctochytrium planicorne]